MKQKSTHKPPETYKNPSETSRSCWVTRRDRFREDRSELHQRERTKNLEMTVRKRVVDSRRTYRSGGSGDGDGNGEAGATVDRVQLQRIIDDPVVVWMVPSRPGASSGMFGNCVSWDRRGGCGACMAVHVVHARGERGGGSSIARREIFLLQ